MNSLTVYHSPHIDPGERAPHLGLIRQESRVIAVLLHEFLTADLLGALSALPWAVKWTHAGGAAQRQLQWSPVSSWGRLDRMIKFCATEVSGLFF